MINLLKKGGYSCVIKNTKGECRTFHKRGVDDIYELWRSEPEFLVGASLADKVIGKAAAALMIKAGVAEVMTPIISAGAVDLFAKTKILLNFETKVDHIINRDKSGWCPMEAKCKDLWDVEQIMEIINKRYL